MAELPARDAQQWQAEANLAAAKADAEKARADLADRTVVAPREGRVERLYFAAGEVAGAGTPVVALLPAEALKVKFYVAEAERAALALGQTVAVACDGCAAGLTARLSYFAADPEFTPPVIYSRDERQRLSFLAEAVLAAGRAAAGPAGDGREAAMSAPAPGAAPAIDVRHLTKRFGDKTVVDDFDIKGAQGAIYGFLGPNGSGSDDDPCSADC